MNILILVVLIFKHIDYHENQTYHNINNNNIYNVGRLYLRYVFKQSFVIHTTN